MTLETTESHHSYVAVFIFMLTGGSKVTAQSRLITNRTITLCAVIMTFISLMFPQMPEF
jgi:hypothetical protein